MTIYDLFIGLSDETRAKIEAALIEDKERVLDERGRAGGFEDYAYWHKINSQIELCFDALGRVKSDLALKREREQADDHEMKGGSRYE